MNYLKIFEAHNITDYSIAIKLVPPTIKIYNMPTWDGLKVLTGVLKSLFWFQAIVFKDIFIFTFLITYLVK